MIDQRLSSVSSHYTHKRFTLLYLEKVLVIFGVSLIIESKVAGSVLAENQLFCCTNLIKKLC